jgi:aminoglycoside 3-N-acetyltransferase
MFTKEVLIEDFKKLGLKSGSVVLVHSALSSLGQVEGGAQTVIEALLATIGPEGTLLMPALTRGSVEIPFSLKTPSYLGVITETFRNYSKVQRSFHPTHSVLGLGKDASYLLADHLKADSACGLGTPYHKLAALGGQVLMLGVDLDRCTLLHTAEDLADCPFLSNRTFYYYDTKGEVQKMQVARFPGPHRDFIGLDQHFRDLGIIEKGRVGNAVVRLIDAAKLLAEATSLLVKDPARVLCDNLNCEDCRRQKGKIYAKRLKEEDFTLAALVADFQPQNTSDLNRLSFWGVETIELSDGLTNKLLINGSLFLESFKESLNRCCLRVWGLGTINLFEPEFNQVKLTRKTERLAELATKLGAEFIRVKVQGTGEQNILSLIRALASKIHNWNLGLMLVNDANGPLASSQEVRRLFENLKNEQIENVELAFCPQGFVASGEKPFLGAFHKLSKVMGNLYLTDSLTSGQQTLLAQGHGEVKELISALRCRGFQGYFTVGSLMGSDPFGIERRLADFWDLFSTL